jgi:hypothetical protein
MVSPGEATMDAHMTAPKDLKEVREFVSPNANPHQQKQKQQQHHQQQQLRIRSMPPEVFDRDSRWGGAAEPNLDLSPPAFRGTTSPSSARKPYLTKRVRSAASTSPERGAKREASFDSIDLPFTDCDHSESESGNESCLVDTDSAMVTMTFGEAPRFTSNSPRKPSPNRIRDPASSTEPPELQLKKNWSPGKQPVKSAMKKKYGLQGMLQKDSKETSSMSTISSCVAPEEENSSLTSSGSKLKFDVIFRIPASSGRGEAAPPIATTPLNPETCENRWNAYGATQLTISSLEAVLPPAFRGVAPTRVRRMVSADSSVPSSTDDDDEEGGTHGNTSSSGDEFLVDDRLPPAYQVAALNEHRRRSFSTVQDEDNNNKSPNKPEFDAQQSFSHTELLQTSSQNAAFGQNISSLSMSTTQDQSSKLEGMDGESSSSENTRDLAPPSLRSAKGDSNVQMELPLAYKPIQTPKSARKVPFQEQQEQQLKEQEKSRNGDTPRLKDAAPLGVKDSAKKGRKANYASMADVEADVDAIPKEEHAPEMEDSTPKERSWKVKHVITVDSFCRENEKGDGEVTADRASNSELVPADDLEAKDGSDQAQPGNNNFCANEEKEEESLPIDNLDDPKPKKKRSCKVEPVMTEVVSRREGEENETSTENEGKPSEQAAPDIRNDLCEKKKAGQETTEDTNVFAKDVNYATNEEPVSPDDQSDTSDPPTRKRSWKVKRVMTVDSFRRENGKREAGGSSQDEEVSGMDEYVSKDAKGKSDRDQATTPDSNPAEDTATAQLSSSSDLPSADSPVQPKETGVATESEVLPSGEQEYDDTPKPKRSWKAKRILTLDAFRRENEAEESTKEKGTPEKKPETSASVRIPSVPAGNEPRENRDAFAPENEETNQVGTEPSQIDSSESTLTEKPIDSKEAGIKPGSGAELETMEINDSPQTKSLKKKKRRGSITGALTQKRERTTNAVPPAPSSSPRKSRKQKRRGSTGALKKREKKKIYEYGRRLKKEAKVDDDYEAWLANNFQDSYETSTNAGESPANPDQNTSLDCEPTTQKSETTNRFEDSKPASIGRHSDQVKSKTVMESSTEFGTTEINDGGEVIPRKKHKRRDSTELLAQKREQALLPKITPPLSSAPKSLRKHKRRGSTGALAQKWEQELLPKITPICSPAPVPSQNKHKRRGSTGALAQRREENKADAQIDSDTTKGISKKDVGTSELKSETEPTPLHSSLDSSFKRMEKKVGSVSEEFAPFDCQPTDESSRTSDEPDALHSYCARQSQEDTSQYGYEKENATQEDTSQYGFEYEIENATKEDASQYGYEKENATDDAVETRPRRKHKRRGSTGALVHHWENQMLTTILPTIVNPAPPPPSPIPARSRRHKRRGSMMGALAQHWEVKLNLSPDANAHAGMQAKESADVRSPIGTSSLSAALPVFSGQEDTSSEMDHVHSAVFDESFPFDCQPTISDRLSASGPCSMNNQMDSLQDGYGDTGTIEIKDDTEVKPRRMHKRRGSTGVFVQKWEQKLQPTLKPVAAPLPLVRRRQERRGSTGALAQMWENELSAASPTSPRRSPKKREKTAWKTDSGSKTEFIANLSLTETSNDDVRAGAEESGLREKQEASRSEHILDKEKTKTRSGSAKTLVESRRSSSEQSAGEPAQESRKKVDRPIGSSGKNLLPKSPKNKSKQEASVAAASEHGTRSSKSSGRLKEEKKSVSRRRSSSTGRLKDPKKSQSGQSPGASVTSSKDRKEKSRSCSRSKGPTKEEKTPKARRRSNSSGRLKEQKASVAAASEHGTRSSKSSERLKEEKKAVSRRRSSSTGRLKDPKESQAGQLSVASVTSSKDQKKKSRSRSRSKGPVREEKIPKERRRSSSSGRMKEQKKAKQKRSSVSDCSRSKKSQEGGRPSTEDEQFQANVQRLLNGT